MHDVRAYHRPRQCPLRPVGQALVACETIASVLASKPGGSRGAEGAGQTVIGVQMLACHTRLCPGSPPCLLGRTCFHCDTLLHRCGALPLVGPLCQSFSPMRTNPDVECNANNRAGLRFLEHLRCATCQTTRLPPAQALPSREDYEHLEHRLVRLRRHFRAAPPSARHAPV